MIIAAAVAITERNGKSEIRSMRTNRFAPTFLIFHTLPATMLFPFDHNQLLGLYQFCSQN